MSYLCCVVDSCHNYFQNALIGGFQAPLHNGPVWSFVFPRFQVSLTDPHILNFLQAYIQFFGFDMSPRSEISQLHTTVCLMICVYYSSYLESKTSYSRNSRRRGGRTRKCYPDHSGIYKTFNPRRVEC
jgi:hypothetical protein